MAMLRSSHSVVVLYAVALVVLVILCYWSAPQNSFHFDDQQNIVDETAVHMNEFSLANLGRAAEHSYLSSRPLPSVTFAIDWWRGGGKPGAFIVTNVVIHTFAVLACFALLAQIFRQCGYPIHHRLFAAAAGAALWATHPIQAQAVTFAVQRMTSMAALFMLLTMFCYLKARTSDRRSLNWWLLCLAAMAAGALSKEIAWMTPVLLLLMEFGVVRHGQDFYRHKRLDRLMLFLPLVVGAMVLLDMVTGIGPFAEHLQGYERRSFTLWERLLTQPRVIAFHLSQIAWPTPDRFSIAHDFITSTSILIPPTTLFAIVAVILWLGTGAFVISLPEYRVVGFFMLFLPVALITESSIIPLEMVFEHRMYLPSVAIAGLLGYAIVKLQSLSKPIYNVACVSTVLVVSVTLVSVTQAVVANWKDDYTLWTQALKRAPMSSRVHTNLAETLRELGQIDTALKHAERAVELDANYVVAIHNLGRIVKLTGDRARAYKLFTRALEVAPGYSPAHFSLGMIFLEAGYYAQAHEQFKKTLQYDPRHREARRFLEYTAKMKD
jgi:tetratricopeptide (TPR) repeat protein